MKRNWSEIGFLRLLIPYIAGLLSVSYFNPSVHILIYISVSLLGLLAFIKFLSTKLIFRYADFIFGVLLNASLFSLGILSTMIHSESYAQHIPKHTNYLISTLSESPIEKENSYKVETQISFIDSTGEKVISNAILYLEKDSNIHKLAAGDILRIKNNLKSPENFDKQFDYVAFLAMKHIHFTGYLNSKGWEKIGREEPTLAGGYIISLRTRFQNSLNSFISSDNERSIASALLLGNKSFLDKETKLTYSQTGAMHILAVSGLHVGILYGILYFLLGRFKSVPRLKWLIILIELIVIWTFAAIADFSPSVLRASTMFSFIAVGMSLSRYVNIYNILALSALVLLIYNPNYIYEVGFQLSYAAVVSIIFFHKYIYGLFITKNKVIDFFWNISAVSIAAQIGTAPLTIYYFNQFPSYFFLSNLLAIPAAFLILSIGLALFSSSIVSTYLNISVIEVFLGTVLEWIISLLNKGLILIQSLPMSTVSMEHIYKPNVLLFYIMIGTSMYFLAREKLAERPFQYLMGSAYLLFLSIGFSKVLSLIS